MFETVKDVAADGELGALAELGALRLAFSVDVLHPGVMVRGRLVSDVLLEDDDVRVGHLNRVA